MPHGARIGIIAIVLGKAEENDLGGRREVLEAQHKIISIYFFVSLGESIHVYLLLIQDLAVRVFDEELGDRVPKDEEAFSDVARAAGYLLAYVGEGCLLEDVHPPYSLHQNVLYLGASVGLEADRLLTHSGGDLGRQGVREVQSVRDGNDDQFAPLLLSPLEDAIEDREVVGLQEVDLVDDEHLAQMLLLIEA